MDTSHLRKKPSGNPKGYYAAGAKERLEPTPRQKAWALAFPARMMQNTELSPNQASALAAADAGYSNPQSAGQYNLHSEPLHLYQQHMQSLARQAIIEAKARGEELDPSTHPIGEWITQVRALNAKIPVILKAHIEETDEQGRTRRQVVTEIVEMDNTREQLRSAQTMQISAGKVAPTNPKSAVQVNVNSNGNGGKDGQPTVQINIQQLVLNQLPPGATDEQARELYKAVERAKRGEGALLAMPEQPIEAQFTEEAVDVSPHP